jgi:hypothetical protein
MRRLSSWAAAAALGLAAMLAAPASATAKPRPKIEWARVDVPEGEGAARHAKVLKEALKKAAKHADFGKATGKITLTARIVELKTETRGDVLRVTCSVSGRVQGGKGARSKISYGGHPERRDALEKEVITMVANGLVARLAQIVRTQAPKVR